MADSLLAPLVAGGVDGICLLGWAGDGAGRSGVGCAENLELRLFIHDARFDPSFVTTFSELPRLKSPGRFCSANLCGDGVEGYACVVSLDGSTGVGGVTLGKDGGLVLIGSDTRCCGTGLFFPNSSESDCDGAGEAALTSFFTSEVECV